MDKPTNKQINEKVHEVSIKIITDNMVCTKQFSDIIKITIL